MMMMTAKVIRPNVGVSVASVPALSGTYFLSASRPAIATGPMMGINRPSNMTKPVETFQKKLLSLNPSKPDPLLALDEVY